MGSIPLQSTIKEESALIQYKFCFKAFLYLNTGVGVPELIVEWTILTLIPKLLGKSDV